MRQLIILIFILLLLFLLLLLANLFDILHYQRLLLGSTYLALLKLIIIDWMNIFLALLYLSIL